MTDCHCDYGEPTFFRQKMRTARKGRRCTECGRTVWKGESYEDVFGVWQDGANAYQVCTRCLSLREYVKALVPCLCWAYGNLINDCLDAATEYHEPGSGLLFGAYRRRVLIYRNERFNHDRA